MTIHIDCWNPLSIHEVQAIFHDAPFKWWIAGGWALDLYLKRQTREHSDMDIVISRDDYLQLQSVLQHDWELFEANKGELNRWKVGEALTPEADNIWVKKKDGNSWTLQIMLLDTVNHQWIYKRHDQISRSIDEIGLETQSGIPYLKPEIQLLYKGGSSVVREKDLIDFCHVLPELTLESRCWLKAALLIQFPDGHPWIHVMNQR